MLLDYAYRAYGDQDLLYGYRMLSTNSANMRLALLNIQQRKYVQTLSSLNQEKKVKDSLKRRPNSDEDEDSLTLPNIE